MAPVHAVDFANITVVDGADPDVDPPTVTIAPGQGTVANVPLGTQGFFIDTGVVVSEYPIRIGATSTDDAASSTGGVLLNNIRENGRFYASTGETLTAIASIVPDAQPLNNGGPTNTRGTTGGFSLVVDRGGSALSTTFPAIAGVRSNNGAMNANLAAAYFPYSQGWIGASTIATTNNAQFSILGSSPGLTLANVVWQGTSQGPAINGGHQVFLPGVTDSRQQGLVFVASCKNEDNFVGVQPLANGSGWSVDIHNGQSGAGEGDPISFVYVPYGTTNVTMASIHGASGPTQTPTVLKSSGSPFTLTRTNVGTYRLSIPGQTPASGVLMINTGGNINNALSSTSEHAITYQADGNDWIIETRDVGNVATPLHPFLETPNAERGQAFQFAFMPFSAPPTAPAANPTPFNFKDKIIGYNVEVTEVDGTQNELPGMHTTVTGGTNGYQLESLRQNRGDNAVAINRVFQSTTDGIVFASVSQGFRDNSGTSGEAAYGIVAAGSVDGAWEISTHIADPGLGSTSAVEHNINFSAVQFGRDTAFDDLGYMAANVLQTGGALTVDIPGVNNTLTDGVLIAQVFGNNDDFAVATPAVDGSNWIVKTYDNNTAASPTLGVNYIYLPYDADNLVAGRVAADGDVLFSTGEGTGAGQFTLTKEAGSGSYLLTIAGKTPADGTLLLTPADTGGASDNVLVYETVGNAFRILGVDQVTFDEKSVSFIFPSLQDTNFSFAFIEHDAPPTIGPGNFLEADFNEDGFVNNDDLMIFRNGFGTGTTKLQGNADGDSDVDGNDLLIFQRQLGTFPPPAVAAAGAVPEPSTLALFFGGVGFLVAIRRK